MFIKLNPSIIINVSAIQLLEIKNDKNIFIHLLKGSGQPAYRIDAKDKEEADKILKSMLEAYQKGDTLWEPSLQVSATDKLRSTADSQ